MNIEGYVHVSHYVLKLVVGILTTVALSGVLTNVVSLGIDQQIDAPSSELCSFISWTSWTFFLGNSLIIVPQSIIRDDNNMHAVWTLILPILSTLSAVCDNGPVVAVYMGFVFICNLHKHIVPLLQ